MRDNTQKDKTIVIEAKDDEEIFAFAISLALNTQVMRGVISEETMIEIADETDEYRRTLKAGKPVRYALRPGAEDNPFDEVMGI